ncbi:phage tail protein [Streptomyces prasinopilosus]|uniref:Phage tail protein domain-containing protein n=1 Tax=Streptomyces prasinopilosus TaxID=67344 RepID=A0A1G6XHY5_9ACTN|nr:phage tail protein [Streptomyces prasinopilosus]SDD76927.1 phage tail protein domain-containing protein [Streptomyces prasinopilosus]
MRGSVDGLGSSAPIGAMLPAIFADDDLAQRFVAGLDEVLAPFLVVLDNLDSYFDPALAPVDFTRWLADWVGAETDGIETGADDERSGNASAGVPAGGSEGERRLRAAVAAATYLHRVRGTRRGLSEAVRLVFGVTPEITESGAADWHARPLGPVPGDRRPHLHVSLALPAPAPADAYRLDALVAAARPAHMPYTVEVTAATAAERTTDR